MALQCGRAIPTITTSSKHHHLQSSNETQCWYHFSRAWGHCLIRLYVAKSALAHHSQQESLLSRLFIDPLMVSGCAPRLSLIALVLQFPLSLQSSRTQASGLCRPSITTFHMLLVPGPVSPFPATSHQNSVGLKPASAYHSQPSEFLLFLQCWQEAT